MPYSILRWALLALGCVAGACQSHPTPTVTTIDLIYGPTCPHSAQVHRTVQRTVGEWQRQHPGHAHRIQLNSWLVPEDALPTPGTVTLNARSLPPDTVLPKRILGYSSPTVLVNGQNLTGVAPQPGLPGCAVQLPTAAHIRDALAAASAPTQ